MNEEDAQVYHHEDSDKVTSGHGHDEEVISKIV